MALIYATNRNKVASSAKAGSVVINQHDWDVTAALATDKVFIGELPAYHALLPELSSLIFNAAVGAATLDVCVDTDANPIFDNSATLGAAFTRVACTTFALAKALGVSQVNRPIYLLLGTNIAAGGVITAQIASAPIS